MSIQIRTGVIRVEVGDNKPLYDTHLISSTFNKTSYRIRTYAYRFEGECSTIKLRTLKYNIFATNS